MTTNYPWDGSICIEVKEAKNTKVHIRIPAWCENPSLNGEDVKSGEYATVVVNTGDIIRLELPMDIVLMQANANVEPDRGMVCIKRGPIIYCAEGCDNIVNLDDIYLNPRAMYTAQEESILDGVVTITTDAVIRKQKKELYYKLVTEEQVEKVKFIPYYAWANREESDMSIWFPKA